MNDVAPSSAPAGKDFDRQSKVADPLWVRFILWLLIVTYLLVMGGWALRAGLKLRTDVWENTRSIRLNDNVASGMRWGMLVLSTAERLANLPPPPRPGAHPTTASTPHPTTHSTTTQTAATQTSTTQTAATRSTPSPTTRPLAKAAPDPHNPNERPLTFWEAYRGEDQVYQDLVVGVPPDGNYDLDYPPLRLWSMTLWAWHTERAVPGFKGWAGHWILLYDATGDPTTLADEDVAAPILLGNSLAVAAAALFAFFLVWIWVNRGGRPALPTPRTGWQAWLLPKRRLAPWRPTPLRSIRGLLVFPIAASAFFYAVVIAETPSPSRIAPSIGFADRPTLSHSANGTVNAIIRATIRDQGADARWHLDWGQTTAYTNHTPPTVAGNDDVLLTLRNLPPHQTIHYRASVQSSGGVTFTDDATFNTDDSLAPMPPRDMHGEVWFDWPLWIGVASLFFAMTGSLFMLPPPHRGWTAGMVAALLMWFDPSILMDAHVWPQWDVWVLPPFMLAALLATLDWWLTAGLVMGVGVMFKGQILVAAPVLALWPLFAGRWGALARMIVGFVLAAGLVLSPWLVLGDTAPVWTAGPIRWIGAVAVAAIIGCTLSLYRPALRRQIAAFLLEMRSMWRGISTDQWPAVTMSLSELIVFSLSLLTGAIAVTLLVLRRWPSDSELPRLAGPLLLLATLIVPWLLPRRALLVFLAAVLAASIWMSAYLFHGDWSWKTVGFEYGTRKHTMMSVGPVGNLPYILESRFGWDVYDTAMTLHPPDIAGVLHLPRRGPGNSYTGWIHNLGLDGTEVDVDTRTFLIAVYGILMAACGIAAAVQARRNDPRILVAFAAIWMLMPNVLCQMGVRYEMWAAAVSCLVIAVSPGLTILHVVVALIAAGGIGTTLMTFDAARSPRIHDFINRFQPDNGWIMLTIGAIFLYVALAPSRRPGAQEIVPP